jgi:glycine/D-amino acid oxidase-like deaminating enzyme
VVASVAVVGAGVVGLATAAALVDAGVQVRCFEAVGPMSQRSTGSSRIFRLAHGSAALVELAAEARSRYAAWSAQAGRELVGAQTTLLAGPIAPAWAEAMRDAGAPVVHSASGAAGLGGPSPVPLGDGPVLLDPNGGVIDAAGVGEFLLRRVAARLETDAVRELELVGSGVEVRTSAGRAERFDACVLAAGAGTAALAEQVGLVVPTGLVRHARFTFRLRSAPRRLPCVLDRAGAWRPGFTSYQHLSGPGEWAIGAHQAGVDETVDGVTREQAIAQAREFTVGYVRENLPDADPEPIDTVYCDSLGGWGDGYVVSRAEAVLSVHGDNLFKLAPVLGARLARAALDGSTPESVHRRPD